MRPLTASPLSPVWLNDAGSYTLLASGGQAAAALAGSVQVSMPVSMPIASVPALPTIIGEKVLTVGKGKHKHIVGFQLSFSEPLDASSADNPANYTIIQTMKHSRATVARAVRFRALYNRTTQSVKLMVPGKPRFAGGGSLVVRATPPTGISSTTGLYLDGNDEGRPGDNALFAILPNGQGIIR